MWNFLGGFLANSKGERCKNCKNRTQAAAVCSGWCLFSVHPRPHVTLMGLLEESIPNSTGLQELSNLAFTLISAELI